MLTGDRIPNPDLTTAMDILSTGNPKLEIMVRMHAQRLLRLLMSTRNDMSLPQNSHQNKS